MTQPPSSSESVVEPDANSSPATDLGPRLMATIDEGLEAPVLPAGFSQVDKVDVDGSGMVSRIFGTVDGPQGPTLWLYTGLPSAAPSPEMAGLEQRPVSELSNTTLVTVSTAANEFRTYVTIDASPTGVIRLVGEDLPEADVLATAERLLEASESVP